MKTSILNRQTILVVLLSLITLPALGMQKQVRFADDREAGALPGVVVEMKQQFPPVSATDAWHDYSPRSDYEAIPKCTRVKKCVKRNSFPLQILSGVAVASVTLGGLVHILSKVGTLDQSPRCVARDVQVTSPWQAQVMFGTTNQCGVATWFGCATDRSSEELYQRLNATYQDMIDPAEHVVPCVNIYPQLQGECTKNTTSLFASLRKLIKDNCSRFFKKKS